MIIDGFSWFVIGLALLVWSAFMLAVTKREHRKYKAWLTKWEEDSNNAHNERMAIYYAMRQQIQPYKRGQA